MPTDLEIGQKETKGAQTERRILDAAEALFAERGFEAASLREIARAAGIRQPGLYNYFESKEALYSAVLDRALAPLSDAIDRFLLRAAPDELHSTLAGVMTDLLLEHPKISALFQRALQGDPGTLGNRLIKDWLDRLFGQAITGIQGGQAGESASQSKIDLVLQSIAMFNITTGFFLSQRIFETLVGGNVTDPEVVARQKALLDRISRFAFSSD